MVGFFKKVKMALGLDSGAKQVELDVSKHYVISGSTGSGFSNVVDNFVKQKIDSEQPLVMISGHEDEQYLDIVRDLIKNSKRNPDILIIDMSDSGSSGTRELKDVARADQLYKGIQNGSIVHVSIPLNETKERRQQMFDRVIGYIREVLCREYYLPKNRNLTIMTFDCMRLFNSTYSRLWCANCGVINHNMVCFSTEDIATLSEEADSKQNEFYDYVLSNSTYRFTFNPGRADRENKIKEKMYIPVEQSLMSLNTCEFLLLEGANYKGRWYAANIKFV